MWQLLRVSNNLLLASLHRDGIYDTGETFELLESRKALGTNLRRRLLGGREIRV